MQTNRRIHTGFGMLADRSRDYVLATFLVAVSLGAGAYLFGY